MNAHHADGASANKEDTMFTLAVLLVGVITGIVINRNGKVTIVVEDKLKKVFKK